MKIVSELIQKPGCEAETNDALACLCIKARLRLRHRPSRTGHYAVECDREDERHSGRKV